MFRFNGLLSLPQAQTIRLRMLGCTALVSAALILGGSAGMAQSNDLGAAGFSISLGGEVIAGAPPPQTQITARADEQLRRANVDVQFDGLGRTRLLNISTDDLRSSYVAGDLIGFRASTNYPAFVSRAEVVIIDRNGPGRSVVAQLPVNPNGTATWAMPADGSANLAYVLRVYDAAGRYDETAPLALTRTTAEFATHATTAPYVAPGEAEDRTARRGIPVNGGLITVSGSNATPGGSVLVMGESVPVDASGRFVVSRIVPVGDQIVTVQANGQQIRRDVTIPARDWFYVAIADVTAGITDGGINDEQDSYINGRLAYYVNGTTANGWRIVSSLDTQDGPIEDIFSRLNDKDPRRVLDRLRGDGSDLYPTYGDDSIAFDDTPTSGNIYVRAENDTTRLTWGNFNSSIQGSALLNSSRDLYGAELRYQSLAVTTEGEARFAATVYAAQPETLAQRDILRGTGGSAYFLSHQDITSGSSTVSVQIVDPDTGYVVETRTLVEGTDYRIDHLQGVIILTSPLSSGASNGNLISGAGTDYDVNLIAQYEYTPTDTSISDSAFGGRAEAWVTDNLRFGVTAMQEEVATGTQQMLGADLRYVLGQNSFVALEVARTDGPGFDRALSTDGGLTITSSGGAVADQAMATHLEAALDFADLGFARAGVFGLYYETKDAGYSTLSEDITADQQLLGLTADMDLSDRAALHFALESFTRDGGEQRDEAELALSYALNDQWTVTGGLAFVDQTKPTAANETGQRLDAALRLGFAPTEDLSIYGFVQGTVDVQGGLDSNNRAGIGGSANLGEKVTLSGEVSGGDGGAAAEARLSYRPTADNEIYLGYALDPTRNGAGSELDDQGRLVFGGSHRYSDQLSTYGETIYDRPGDGQSLAQAYGVTYTPNAVWVLSGGIETGEVRDDVDGNFDRMALSFGAAYAPSEDLSSRMRLEYRTENGDTAAQDRDTWALSAGYSNQVNDNWRVLASAEALYSESAEGDFRNGEYLRASLGYAYRPIANERLNVLLRYTFLHDLPGEDQVDANGDTDGPSQRSNVLSVTANYDLNPLLTVTGKLGYRLSDVADRGSDDFTSNTATLVALRLDYHIVEQWDIMAEGRMLLTAETGTTETGAVIGVYRNLGENAQIGVGYDWGSVSDDETQIDYQAQGLFLNIVGRF